MYVDYGYSAHDNEDAVLYRTLAKSTGFNDADLADNREGRMSTKQMLALTYKGVIPLLGLIIPLAGVIALAIGLYFFGPMILHRITLLIKLGNYLMMGLGAAALGLFAVLVKAVIASRRLLSLIADLATGKCATAEGRVSVSRSDEIEDGLNQITGKRTMMYFFVLGERTFQVSQQAHDELSNSGGVAWLKLHFTPRSQYLLSVEAASRAQQERAA